MIHAAPKNSPPILTARTGCTIRCGKVTESCAPNRAIRGKNRSDVRHSSIAGRGAFYPPLGAAHAHTDGFRDAYQVENQREYRDSVAAKSGRHPLYRTPLRRKLQHPFSLVRVTIIPQAGRRKICSALRTANPAAETSAAFRDPPAPPPPPDNRCAPRLPSSRASRCASNRRTDTNSPAEFSAPDASGPNPAPAKMSRSLP